VQRGKIKGTVGGMKVLQIFGTRPEAIKMAPVVKVFEESPQIENFVCVTAQHRDMLDQVLGFFDIRVDHDLDVMRDAQGLADVTARILAGLTEVFKQMQPELVLVHGDTNTTMSASLAAFYQQIPIGHVEAGLRTHNLHSPWPEEGNRLITDSLSAHCFAPTEGAKQNLLKENTDPTKIVVTGNTVIDALFEAKAKITSDTLLKAGFDQQFSFLNRNKKLLLVTGHRRESFGEGFENICAALSNLAERNDVEILYPVHLNPNVRGPVHQYLSEQSNIHLIAPQDYPTFVYLMDRCDIILTDSGGVQEEAPSLGKPVLVMRDTTERPEAVDAGTVKLVGTDKNLIIASVIELLENQQAYAAMADAHNPYGDGTAANQILEAIIREYI
jgi:UDP-N-acetylglucosamine 2-epimerase (non-hydrolysing)